MTNVFAAAAEIQEFLLEQKWEFCLIGGIAVQRWGDPRVTVDADVTLLSGFSGEEKFIDPILRRFRSRRDDAREMALRQRVLLLLSTNGTGIDVALGGLPFEINSVHRATKWRGPDDQPSLITCSAEDLIVHKAFAARERDWADVISIVMRQGRKLNLEQIWTELRPLVELKEEPEILTKLQKIFDEQLD